MFNGQPKGLYALALANTGERFGYYTMLAVFALFLKDNFGFNEGTAGLIYSSFLMLVYFLPLFGGMLADKIGYGKCVTVGISIMFLGYLFLAIPLGSGTTAIVAMGSALLLICLGTALFKGNLQVLVGNLYEDPKYASQRDNGFSLFYMAINIGAMFAASAAIGIMLYMQNQYGYSKEDSYHFAFGIACISLIISIAIYFAFRNTFKHADYSGAKSSTASQPVEEISKSETKERIVALCLVFAVVIFFWMAFHQNGSTLTFFAEQYTNHTVTGIETMFYDVWNLVLLIFVVYGLFGLFQNGSAKSKAISGIVVVLAAGGLIWKYFSSDPSINIEAPIFQQFNPAFVVLLTPVSMAIFGALAKKGKEPKAPLKIGLGMLVAAAAYIIMTLSCVGLPEPSTHMEGGKEIANHVADVTPNLLIITYLILTFAELLLSPIGISFVSKVAPPKYKGMMMGGWFVATAIGNFLVAIPALMWGQSLTLIWGVLAVICLVSAAFIFCILKKLNKVA